MKLGGFWDRSALLFTVYPKEEDRRGEERTTDFAFVSVLLMIPLVYLSEDVKMAWHGMGALAEKLHRWIILMIQEVNVHDIISFFSLHKHSSSQHLLVHFFSFFDNALHEQIHYFPKLLVLTFPAATQYYGGRNTVATEAAKMQFPPTHNFAHILQALVRLLYHHLCLHKHLFHRENRR